MCMEKAMGWANSQTIWDVDLLQEKELFAGLQMSLCVWPWGAGGRVDGG